MWRKEVKQHEKSVSSVSGYRDLGSAKVERLIEHDNVVINITPASGRLEFAFLLHMNPLFNISHVVIDLQSLHKHQDGSAWVEPCFSGNSIWAVGQHCRCHWATERASDTQWTCTSRPPSFWIQKACRRFRTPRTLAYS